MLRIILLFHCDPRTVPGRGTDRIRDALAIFNEIYNSDFMKAIRLGIE